MLLSLQPGMTNNNGARIATVCNIRQRNAAPLTSFLKVIRYVSKPPTTTPAKKETFKKDLIIPVVHIFQYYKNIVIEKSTSPTYDTKKRSKCDRHSYR